MPSPRNAKAEARIFFPSLLHSPLRLWLRKAKPKYGGAVLLRGLEDKVKVFWDAYGVPHVFAANERDLFLAQGYLHAQERLWQMESKRRFLSGRLSEILGDRQVPWRELSIRFRGRRLSDVDYFVRLLGMQRAARASLALLSEKHLALVEAYCQGVNRYIESHLKSLPMEFRLLRHEPEPWRPEDALAIGKGFAFFLSTSLFTRLTWIALAGRLKERPDKLRSLVPAYPAGGPTITRSVMDDAVRLLSFLNGTFQRTEWAAAAQGSNSWVVAPSRSSTNGPILCNDPHLRLDLPAFWYLMHLKAASGNGGEAFEVWGASCAGAPAVQIGCNRWIGWGVTAALCDDADLYREKLHPDNPDLYLAGGRWEKLAAEEERIKLRGGREIIKKIRFSRHGPLISDFVNDASGVRQEALSFKWTAHEPSREFRANYELNRARNWEEFLQALSHQTAPTLNYIYADAGGNIGYSLAGKIPQRSPSPSLDPLPGWEPESEWKGSIPFGELPRLYNPPEGAIATANNRVVDPSYPHRFLGMFDPPYRIRRIEQLLSAKKKLSPEDMAQIQRDSVSLQGRELLAALKSDLAEAARADGTLQKAVEQLLSWDGSCSEESVGAALFHFFYQRLMTNLLLPALGEETFSAFIEIFNQSIVPVDEILRDPRSPWFENGARPALVKKSLQEAAGEIARRLGNNVKEWRWGKVHRLALRHSMSRVRLLAPLLSIRPFPSPGDGVTINMGFFRRTNPFEQIVGASLRMILEIGDRTRSRFILPSGQSGHWFSPHYRDQTELWRHGGTIRLSYEEEEMDSWPLLTLAPQGAPKEKT